MSTPHPVVPSSSLPARLLRAAIGVRQWRVIAGVRYTEVTTEPLARALSERGSGGKEYALSFPGGRRMRIRVTPTRPYADLSGPAFLPLYAAAEPFLRPGMRVLAIRSGTGYVAEWLSHRVGPSGAVVALDDDNESIRYARWRYPLSNVAFETGGAETLAGESDGAFDAAMLAHALRDGEDAAKIIADVWRVVAPGGWLLVTAPRGVPTRRASPDPLPPMAAGAEELLSLVMQGTVTVRARGAAGHRAAESALEPMNRASEARVSMVVPPAIPADCAGVFAVKPPRARR